MPTQKNVDTMMLYSGPLSVCLYLSLSLSLLLSGACHVDVAASMSWRHVQSIYPKRATLPSPGRNWAGADRPQPSQYINLRASLIIQTCSWSAADV